MAVYLVTGKLGSGKSLATVGRIRDYLNQARPVATNLDLNMENLINPFAKNSRVIRLPDKPTVDDLEALDSPLADGEYDEQKTGLIVLDECGTWFNTRSFQDKARQPLINKMLHIRKCGWDVMFIVQHIEMIDKQVREGLGEHIVQCQRADRLGIPFITPLFKLFGLNIRPPKLHLALVKYGTGAYAPVVDRWVYNGSDLYDAYDTRQVFGANDCAIHSLLPPNTTFGRYTTQGQYTYEKFKTSIRNIINSASKASRLFFLTGLALGVMGSSYASRTNETNETQAIVESDQAVDEITETVDPVDADIFDPILRITASVAVGNEIQYYFEDERTRQLMFVDPSTVRAIDYCTARIVFLNESKIVNCDNQLPFDADL